MIDLEKHPLGEPLDPCICCHPPALKTFATINKRLPSIIKQGDPFFLKVGRETLYVDRGRYTYEQAEDGKFKILRGPLSKHLTVKMPKLKVRRKAAKNK